MKILVDIRPLMDAQYSGVSEYVFRFLSALLKIDRKNEYILFCNAAHGVAKRLPRFDYSNVKVVTRHIPNKIFNYAMLWPFGRPYFDKLVNEKVDIFFMPHLQFAAVSPKVKTVLAIHDLSFLIDRSFFSWRKNVWHWFINAPALIRKFDRVVAVSHNTKQDIIEMCKVAEDKVSVIHSGIDESFKVLDKGDQRLEEVKKKYNLVKPFILFLATIEPRKNIEALVESFVELKEKGNSDLQLVLAGGRGWKSAPIFKKIKDSKYNQDIIILDYVDAADRPALYNLARVFAYPSFYEGFGFPPLEAMACGTPTVVAADSSLPEIVGNAGILIDPYTISSLTKALDMLLHDEALRADLIEKGLVQAAQFHWEAAARGYLQLFEQMALKS